MNGTYSKLKLVHKVLRRFYAGSTKVQPKLVLDKTNVELCKSLNADIKAGGVVPVFRKALLFQSKVAVQDDLGIYTYAGLYEAARSHSQDISTELKGETKATVAYMCSNNASHIIVQWAIWMSGNIGVPLSSLHPASMLSYFIEDSNASLLICSEEHLDAMSKVAKSRPILVATRGRMMSAQLSQTVEQDDVAFSNDWYRRNDAMLIYTSGTTSKPKGVVWTHKMLSNQIAALHEAWTYSANDIVLHTLPLHHIHGQLNSLNASLAAGAKIRMLNSFVSHTVWARLIAMGEADDNKVTVFHGVPSMYAKLIADHEKMFSSTRTAEYVKMTLANRMRLMCCGSAPLPSAIFEKWHEISGHKLLERYGMSEVGMALSNPYKDVAARTIGSVGLPLPGVSCRIAAPGEDGTLKPLVTVSSENPSEEIDLNKYGFHAEVQDLFNCSGRQEKEWPNASITYNRPGSNQPVQGELLIKGLGVFRRYWNRAPQLSDTDFTYDGWFRTGDTALFSDNNFKILGRTSIDIIKTGGYKVSAVQVESVLLNHPEVVDAGVIGLPDPTWGEKVVAILVVRPESKLDLAGLRNWAKEHLAPYQIPTRVMFVDQLPRNIMGKIDKKELRKLLS